jgi:hypothetical protein
MSINYTKEEKETTKLVRKRSYDNFNNSSKYKSRSNIRCGGIIFSNNGKHIVIVQNKYMFEEKNKVLWGLPKGHIKKNETYAQCAQREIFEETGIRVNILEKHPKIKINNTFYFPIKLNLNYNDLKKIMYINDKVEIENISVLPISELCKNTNILNYELRKCINSYLLRAKRIANEQRYPKK